MRRHGILASALGLALLASAWARAAAPEPVDLALVLAVDVSESVDEGSYALQHEGIARAFQDAALVGAIGAGRRGAIEVVVVEWSDRDKQIVTVDWTRIGDAASAGAFAARVRASQRSSNGLTAIGDALRAAHALLARAPFAADRRLVDISGDGMANIGPDVETVRDELVGDGITINGLAILATEPWLSDYYNQYVIGGTGAFLVEADGFAAFARAIESKLLGEVAGARPPGATAPALAPNDGGRARWARARPLAAIPQMQ
jgi:hypothetical protein